MSDKVEVRNVNAPHHIARVDCAKYEAMRDAYLAVLPSDPPGASAAETKAALLPSSAQRTSRAARRPDGG